MLFCSTVVQYICAFFFIGVKNDASTAANTLELFGLRAKSESQQELLGKSFANLQKSNIYEILESNIFRNVIPETMKCAKCAD